jgi:hypothetical protein
LVVLFRKVQKDIIGEQDKRYEDLKGDLRDVQSNLRTARREALRAKKHAENSEAMHARCELNNRLLRRVLAARGYVDDSTLLDAEPDESVLKDPSDEELDAELGYTDTKDFQ